MELSDLLNAFDRTAANVAKLEAVLERATPFMPTGPSFGSDPEYDDLRRAWVDLLAGLRPIDGWTVTGELPDIGELGQAFLDFAEISVLPTSVWDAIARPAKDLAEYKYRLNRARRKASRERLFSLMTTFDAGLAELLADVDRNSVGVLAGESVDLLRAAFGEIERLMADTVQRRGRWSELHRHMHFGEGHDWHDVHEFDWPTVRDDIESGALAEVDPLPVPEIDLGEAAAGRLTGVVTTALPWSRIDDGGFERMLYDLLRSIPEYENVQWLSKTRATDRGRDLSLDRVLRDGSGAVRTERVAVQAKHWLSKSVGPAEIQDAVSRLKLWTPMFRGLIVATSGRFSADAIAYQEQHNERGDSLLIDLWPEVRLETLLAERPALAAAHGLR